MTFDNNLSYQENMNLLKMKYEYESGLQAMHLRNEKELELIKRSNALAVLGVRK